jgi:maltose alpha-D-glucosyltransferase/alpha-amylase
VLPVQFTGAAYVLLVQVEFGEGAPDTYVVPITFMAGERASRFLEEHPQAVIARVQSRAEEGILIDALAEPTFCTMVLEAIRTSAPFETGRDRPMLVATAFPGFAECVSPAGEALAPGARKAEQSHTSINFGNQVILKVYRRVEEGPHPELEVGRFLTEKKFPHSPPVLGNIEVRKRRAGPLVLALLLKCVPNQGEAWQYTLDELSSFFERALAEAQKPDPELPVADFDFRVQDAGEAPEAARRLIGAYLESANLLGRRTAEMHTVLASDHDNPAFAPEPFGKLYQRSVYQSLRNLVGNTFALLRRQLPALPELTQHLGRRLLEQIPEVLHRFQGTVDRKFTGLRTRYHGDYHLGQVLYTGKDFVIVDFEGEPVRSLNDRRIKRSPLRDVAKMILSFHNAARVALSGLESARGRSPGVVRPEDMAARADWARFWFRWVSAAFLTGYLHAAAGQKFLPEDRDEFSWQLSVFLLEKGLVELNGELTYRPDWAPIPMLALLKLLDVTP